MSKAEVKAETEAAAAAHQELMEKLDFHSIHKTFRNPHWRPNQRRNKNIKAILGESSRKEAISVIATPAYNSDAATPTNINPEGDGLFTSGTSTPAGINALGAQPNLAQASRSLSKLVMEKNMAVATNGSGVVGPLAISSSASIATYTNIESAPSLAPLKHYCDVTGLPAPYMDPKTRMRYHNSEVFAMIRGLPQGMGEQFLEVRGAHTVLK